MRKRFSYLSLVALLVLALVVPLVSGCDTDGQGHVVYWYNPEDSDQLNVPTEGSIPAVGVSTLRFEYAAWDGSDFGWFFRQFIHDESVSIRIRDATTNRLITGFTYGYGIVIDDAAKEYRQDFDPARYNLQSGTRLKVMVYFGGKLKSTAYVTLTGALPS